MARNEDYKVLLVTSLEELAEPIDELAKAHFANAETLLWEMGEKESKPAVMARLDAGGYNLIISYLNGVIFKRRHLDQASFGAVNIHPAPPEHPGLWAFFCQPVIRRDIRRHHGVTLHEIDEEIDHGPIYAVERWDIGESDSIESVMEAAFERSMAMLEFAVKKLAASDCGSKCFSPIDERWDAGNAHHSIEDVRAWFRDLDPAHPAHAERIFFNHPKAIMEPPYFSDEA
jgi:methionyl-tRNA formyltransferase